MNGRFTFFAALALCACEAVPDVTYDDGGADAGATNTCPTNPPPYAIWCCGPVACLGPNCVPTCSECMANCTVEQLCCPNGKNHAVCRSVSQGCP